MIYSIVRARARARDGVMGRKTTERALGVRPTTLATESELYDRRRLVLSLRLRKMSEAVIAAVIGVSQQTVSRDLTWIQQNWRDRYGSMGLDPSEEIGEAVALFEEAEHEAMMEFASLQTKAQDRRISPMFVARQRMACLRTAMAARVARVDMLASLGLIRPSDGGDGHEHGFDVGRADEIRAVLRSRGLLSSGGDGNDDDEFRRGRKEPARL